MRCWKQGGVNKSGWCHLHVVGRLQHEHVTTQCPIHSIGYVGTAPSPNCVCVNERGGVDITAALDTKVEADARPPHWGDRTTHTAHE